MFDLPDAKRVRRSDLFSASASPASSRQSSPAASSSDAELTAILRDRLNEKLGITIPDPASAAQTATQSAAAAAAAAAEKPQQREGEEEEEAEEEELSFRLFSGPAAKPSAGAATPAPVQKIRLRSPSLDPSRPVGFVNPSRPRSYYFAPALSPSDRRSEEYAAAAISGADVRRLAAETRWPGCAVPWKVSVVDPVSGRMRCALEGHGRVDGEGEGAGGEGAKSGKRRKGKKARMALRKKAAKGLERREAAERQKAEKEEHERAKRAEKNRKQKLKRREKERAKKAAERGEEGAAGVRGGEEQDVVMGEED